MTPSTPIFSLRQERSLVLKTGEAATGLNRVYEFFNVSKFGTTRAALPAAFSGKRAAFSRKNLLPK
jgi:hypothetical protein